MEQWIIRTTVDITNTNVHNRITDDPNWLLMRNQQRNLDTLLQVISLKSQPLNARVDQTEIMGHVLAPMAPMLFLGESAEPYPIKLWMLTFEIEHSGALPLDWLLHELHGIPIVPNLTETIVSFPPMFLTHGRFTNTLVNW